jgi:hypothetical protein
MTAAVDVVERAVERELDADDLLRAAVAALVEEPGVDWAGIAFVEDAELRVGPSAGVADEARRLREPVVFQGSRVAEVWIDGAMQQADLHRIAELVAPYALIGWDTGGETWDP